MNVAGDTKVESATEICTEFEGVITGELGGVGNELELIFILIQGAITTIDAQT